MNSLQKINEASVVPLALEYTDQCNQRESSERDPSSHLIPWNLVYIKCSIAYRRIKSRWIKDLDTLKTHKNTSTKYTWLCYLQVGKNFLCMMPEPEIIKGKPDVWYINIKTKIQQEPLYWEFPGGPVVRTPRFHCWGPRFDPWSGN